jgi:hypothetical protein
MAPLIACHITVSLHCAGEVLVTGPSSSSSSSSSSSDALQHRQSQHTARPRPQVSQALPPRAPAWRHCLCRHPFAPHTPPPPSSRNATTRCRRSSTACTPPSRPSPTPSSTPARSRTGSAPRRGPRLPSPGRARATRWPSTTCRAQSRCEARALCTGGERCRAVARVRSGGSSPPAGGCAGGSAAGLLPEHLWAAGGCWGLLEAAGGPP